jgi:hypothetical protein
LAVNRYQRREWCSQLVLSIAITRPRTIRLHHVH